MSNPSTPHKHSLPQLSVKYLRELINSPAWATDLTKMMRGAEALDKLPEVENEPFIANGATAEQIVAFRKETKEWSDKVLAEFELTEKQQKAVKFCLKFYLPKAALPPNTYSKAIFVSFDIASDEEKEE